ncbi:cation:proton antiporter [Candidatus Amarolinea dominans]|uniref:cation:proton antiporter domain-containing protein n=1 Tax=Candidatus Amarolinea dominans TaxID=3140696 RepID=UPI001DF902FB|nr:cation:proton antiporter [Anaerolineae bacterium]
MELDSVATNTTPTESRTRSPLRAAIGYVLMVVVSVGAFLLIRRQGEMLVAPVAGNAGPSLVTAPTPDIFLHVLVALTAIIITGQVLARLFARLGQPAVIGEVVAGILLGPSLLGSQLSALILPPSVGPYLGVIAQLGVVLYMFLVGLELNPARLKDRTRATLAISHASILVPFILGALLALLLYPQLSDRSVPFTSFALFIGVAMSITAFPVLARILTDYRLTRTNLGVIALSCAAVDDVTAWCLLAFVVGVAKAQVGQGLFVVVGSLGFIALILLVARPALRWIALRWETQKPSVGLMTVVFVALLLSALTAEAIGIHAIFGAFLLGVVVPHDSALARAFTQQLRHVVTILLLPAFFAFTGMRTRIDLLSAPALWLLCGLIIVTAIAGKFGGTFAAARLTGLRWREAALLGALMNTRGLMELIVLNVGLELGVISPTLFAMMVLMALVTTMLTSPLLRILKLQTIPEE